MARHRQGARHGGARLTRGGPCLGLRAARLRRGPTRVGLDLAGVGRRRHHARDVRPPALGRRKKGGRSNLARDAEELTVAADDCARLPLSRMRPSWLLVVARGSAWLGTRFGTEGSEVRILSPRPLFTSFLTNPHNSK